MCELMNSKADPPKTKQNNNSHKHTLQLFAVLEFSPEHGLHESFYERIKLIRRTEGLPMCRHGHCHVLAWLSSDLVFECRSRGRRALGLVMMVPPSAASVILSHWELSFQTSACWLIRLCQGISESCWLELPCWLKDRLCHRLLAFITKVWQVQTLLKG